MRTTCQQSVRLTMVLNGQRDYLKDHCCKPNRRGYRPEQLQSGGMGDQCSIQMVQSIGLVTKETHQDQGKKRCLNQCQYCCDETSQPKKLDEERVYSAYTSTSQFIINGSQDRQLKQGRHLEAGADTEVLEGCLLFLVVCTACFLIESRIISPSITN